MIYDPKTVDSYEVKRDKIMKKLEEEEALESKKNQDECVDFKDSIKKSEEERI